MSHRTYPPPGSSNSRIPGGSGPRYPLSPPPSSPLQPQARSPRVVKRARDIYLEQAVKHHLDLLDRGNDFHILMLGSNRLFGFASNAKRAWLAREWGQALEYCGSVAAVMAMSKALLDEEADDSGIKPEPGTVEHDIKYLQIPGTAISLRFWPGSLAAAEYCMDFVVTNSQQPINVPEGYELWVVPDPAMPWLKPVSMRLLSIEQAHGIPPSQIHPGEEKFILRDGLLCLLRNERVGLELHFYVPVRAEFRATPVVEIHRPV